MQTSVTDGPCVCRNYSKEYVHILCNIYFTEVTTIKSWNNKANATSIWIYEQSSSCRSSTKACDLTIKARQYNDRKIHGLTSTAIYSRPCGWAVYHMALWSLSMAIITLLHTLLTTHTTIDLCCTAAGDVKTPQPYSDILLLKKLLFYLLFSYDRIILISVYFQFLKY